MAKIRLALPAVLMAMAAVGVFAPGGAQASEQTVDLMTQRALALDVHPDQGAARFGDYCARCHGSEGQGDPDRVIPALAGQRFTYIVRQLANFAGAERASETMHRVVTQQGLREPQTWVDIAAYLNRLPSTHRAQTGSGRQMALGRGIFQEQCASCHSGDAHGDRDGFVPSLRNQQYPYLVSQLHKLANGHRRNVDEELVRFLGSFGDRDIDAVADYLSRLQGPGAVRRIMRNDGVVVD